MPEQRDSHQSMQLKAAAEHSGFDLGLLRALCCLYRSPWRAQLFGAVGPEFSANGTIGKSQSCTIRYCLLFLTVQ